MAVPEVATLTAAAMLSEARQLVREGWCPDAHARDAAGREVASWSDEARSWSLLGALLASWHRHDASAHDGDIAAHLADAHALGNATEVLGEVVETASLERWNAEQGRTQAEVLDAMDRALRLLRDG